LCIKIFAKILKYYDMKEFFSFLTFLIEKYNPEAFNPVIVLCGALKLNRDLWSFYVAYSGGECLVCCY